MKMMKYHSSMCSFIYFSFKKHAFDYFYYIKYDFLMQNQEHVLVSLLTLNAECTIILYVNVLIQILTKYFTDVILFINIFK